MFQEHTHYSPISFICVGALTLWITAGCTSEVPGASAAEQPNSEPSGARNAATPADLEVSSVQAVSENDTSDLSAQAGVSDAVPSVAVAESPGEPSVGADAKDDSGAIRGSARGAGSRRNPPPARRVPRPGAQRPGGKPGAALPDLEASAADQSAGADGSSAPSKEPDVPQDIAAGRVPNDVKKTNNRLPGGEKDMDAKLSIEFGQEKHDFGAARQGDILEHTFELASTGKNPVRIRQASPTCGCTVGKVLVEDTAGEFQAYKMGDPVDAGRKVQLVAVLNTTSKQNKTQVRINVYTNDPIGMTQLSLAANIDPFIKATPPFVNLGDIKEGQTKSQVIDIRTSRGERVMLTSDAANPIKAPAGMTIDLQPVGPDPEGRSSHWQASIEVGDGAREGPIGYQLRLLSDMEMPESPSEHAKHGAKGHSAKFYKVHASVNGRILGALSFTPQFLSMGLVRPGQRVKRNVKVISHDPTFDLSEATVELVGEQGKDLPWADRFSASVRPAVGLNNAIDVQLVLDGLPDGSDGSFRGMMLIKTGHSTKPELSVRFSGVCRAGVPVPARGGR